MTTESRPWKKDVTKGEWITDEEYAAEGGKFRVVRNSAFQYAVGEFLTSYADAQLVAEAGTVLHQTGMTPGELAERVEHLESLLAECAEHLLNAKLQIEYLHDRFGETGSGNGVIAQLEHCIATVNRSI